MRRRIYVACLASYNAGVLHGTWIDVEGKDCDDLHAEVSAMLRASPHPNVMVDCPACSGDQEGDAVRFYTDEDGACAVCGVGQVPSAEEHAIHDTEGYPDGVVGEFTPLTELAAIEEALSDVHDEDAFFALLGHECGDLERARMVFEEGYRGEWHSLGDYAEETAEDLGLLADVPQMIRQHVDFDGMGQDWERSGDIFTLDAPRGRIYIFDGTL